MSSLETISDSNEIQPAHDHSEVIENIFEKQTAGRFFNPLENPSATEELRQTVESWKDSGDAVVMVFGGFDAPFHINHQQFLLDCKIHGVKKFYEENHEQITGTSWGGMSPTEQQGYIEATLADERVKLVVSTDGDDRIGNSKGFNPDKGGSPRPLQSWPTRAQNLSSLSLQLTEHNHRTPIVDAVTIHDHIALPDTPHAVPADLVATLQPDVWTLYFEAENDIEVARNDSRLRDMDVFVIQGDGYRKNDPLTGKPFSTTGLVKRVKGE